MMKYLIRLLITAAILTTGCSKTDPDITGQIRHPDVPPTVQPDKGYDFTPELTNRSTRYVSENLTMNYDNCGIIIIRTDSSIRFVNLTTDDNAVISSDTPFKAGDMTGVTILENGRRIPVCAVKIESISSSDIYLNILTLNNQRIIVAVTDL